MRVAVVLALKGVGRFPDLKDDGGRGAATERFIIGTFASVLWAAGCAGVVALVDGRRAQVADVTRYTS